MANPIFSQSALDALSSPEQLNQLIKVTSPRAWIALWTVVAVLAAILAWSVFGRLPTRIAGHGILIGEGGTFHVVVADSGVLTDFKTFAVGEKITRGELLGRVEDPKLQQRLAAAQNDIAQLQAAPAPEATRLAQAREVLNRLRSDAGPRADVRSERDGVVVEALASEGDTVSAGQPVLSIEYGHAPLRAMIYLPARSNAKLLRPGVTAEISPVTSRRERDGYLTGKVLSVSKYPASEAGMMTLLHNAALVQTLSSEGPPIAVEVALTRDGSSRSGYQWSSDAGMALEVGSGTLCTGSFVVESRRPISLIFPMFDRPARH
jgi:biotin carboxyl carrier protein